MGKSYSIAEASEKITRGARNAHWVISQDRPGRLIGRYTRHVHVAVVDIDHDNKTYSIRYRESTNLHADPARGLIHQAYNEWVTELDRAIRAELAK